MEYMQIVKNPEKFDFLSWMQAVRREIDGQNDRATILLMCAILDSQLQKLLSSFLVDCKESIELLKGNDFSNKINLCFCLGIISKNEQKTLHILRRIRNSFAHDIKPNSFTFQADNQSVDLSKQLSIPDGMYVPETLIVSNGKINSFATDTFEKAGVRDRIILAFNYITFYLESRVLYLERRTEYTAPTQWQLIQNTMDSYTTIRERHLALLQKHKEHLLGQEPSKERDQALDNIERELQDVTNGTFGFSAAELTITPAELESYLHLMSNAIKQSYGIKDPSK